MMRLSLEQTTQIINILQSSLKDAADCCEETLVCNCADETINGFIIIADVTDTEDVTRETTIRTVTPELQSNTYSEGLLAVQNQLKRSE